MSDSALTEAFLEMLSAERGARENTLDAYKRDLDDARGVLRGGRHAVGLPGHGSMQQPRGAVADPVANLRLPDLRQSDCPQGGVHAARQIRHAVDQRAVEVEQHSTRSAGQ